MPSGREDLESHGAGALHDSPSPADSGSRYQHNFGLCDLGPANWQDLAVIDATKQKYGRICGFHNQSFVSLHSCNFHGWKSMFRQCMRLKYTSTGKQHQFRSH